MTEDEAAPSLALPAEAVLLGDIPCELPRGEEVYIFVPHGRLAHWTYVTISLFALTLSRGWNPRLIRLSESAFNDELCRIYDDYRRRELSFSPTKPHILASQANLFFLNPKFQAALSSLDQRLYSHATTLLARELTPIALHLSVITDHLMGRIGVASAEEFRNLTTFSLHLRRGDTAVLFREDYANTQISNLFQGEVLIRLSDFKKNFPAGHPLAGLLGQWVFVSREEFQRMCDESWCHAAVWYKKRKPIQYYLKGIESTNAAAKHIIAFSDGFHPAAQALCANATHLVVSDVRSVVEAVAFAPLHRRAIRVFSGEPDPEIGFVDLLRYAMNANYIVAQESSFPSEFISIMKKSLAQLNG